MANFKFNKVLNGEQVYGRNAKNDIAMYLFVVSARRASRHAGTVLDPRSRVAAYSCL
jgi:hypothetical protein